MLNSSEHTRKQVTLQASDENGHCVTIKIASHLKDVSGNLKIVTFIKFQHLKHSYDAYFSMHSVVLCVALKIIGFSYTFVQICDIMNNLDENEPIQNNTTLKEEGSTTEAKPNAINKIITPACEGKFVVCMVWGCLCIQ